MWHGRQTSRPGSREKKLQTKVSGNFKKLSSGTSFKLACSVRFYWKEKLYKKEPITSHEPIISHGNMHGDTKLSKLTNFTPVFMTLHWGCMSLRKFAELGTINKAVRLLLFE